MIGAVLPGSVLFIILLVFSRLNNQTESLRSVMTNIGTSVNTNMPGVVTEMKSQFLSFQKMDC